MPTTPTYESPALFPPDVIEVTLRIGVVRSQDHLQAQLEVVCSTDGALLSMESWPHLAVSEWSRHERLILAKVLSTVAMVTGPF